MSNTKLIKALRCKTSNINDCTMCAYHNACYDGTLENIAADVLEADEKFHAELVKNIEHWKKQVIRLRAQLPKWVSVKDRLPKFDTPVIVTYIGWNTGEIRCDLLATYNGIEWRYWDSEPLNVVSVEITHWMELPEPSDCGAKMTFNDKQETKSKNIKSPLEYDYCGTPKRRYDIDVKMTKGEQEDAMS